MCYYQGVAPKAILVSRAVRMYSRIMERELSHLKQTPMGDYQPKKYKAGKWK